MYNIAIENDTQGYTFITHNNPSLNPLKVVAKTLSKFRYELDKVDTGLFIANLFLNIASLDSKKKPSFYLSLRSALGENHAAICVVSVKNQAAGAFDEKGRLITRYTFKDLILALDGSPEDFIIMPRGYEKSNKVPEAFTFA